MLVMPGLNSIAVWVLF